MIGCVRSHIRYRIFCCVFISLLCVACLFIVSCDDDDDDDNNNDTREMTGTIRAKSTPKGASIWLDGQDTGEITNVDLTGIVVGMHNAGQCGPVQVGQSLSVPAVGEECDARGLGGRFDPCPKFAIADDNQLSGCRQGGFLHHSEELGDVLLPSEAANVEE